jgi:DNA-binding winged helix-turn-helix (wHTH) protein/tetratricopeptide (TPR) repeat protein
MTDPKLIRFDAFAIDAENELLYKGAEIIRLRPKTFALLRQLADHPGRLVTKADLLNAIWKNYNVGEEALKHCVTEIRRVLNDDAETPQYIETVHRRGYRFIGKIDSSPSSKERGVAASQKPAVPDRLLVGRTAELAQLHHCLATAMGGSRQVVFVTGDQGIGKTSLVDAFISIVNPDGPSDPDDAHAARPLIARGQCIRAHGAGEAYMPFLEALSGLGASPHRKQIIPLLHRYAPLWLAQMPSLVSSAQLQSLQRSTLGATRERMMREMAEALEAITAQTSLILILEDLHWSDYSTLDLISYWAQRRSLSRLLLIATYRPSDIAVNHHPLRTIQQELEAHRQCLELPLSSLDGATVQEYLGRRYPGHRFPKEVASWLQDRTGGNPLFMVNVLDHLATHGLLLLSNGRWILNTTLETAAQTVPPTIQQIIERQFERHPPEEQQLLMTASVNGDEFSAAEVAAMLGKKVEKIDAGFRAVAKRNIFLQRADTAATSSSRYKFNHALYQTICYQLLPEELRTQYHRKIAGYIEKTNPDHLGKLAARLAVHYDRGHQPGPALQYYQKAAENANARYAGQEALELATQGLQLLSLIPEGPDRIEQEIRLLNSLGTALMSARGLGIEEVRQTFNRARTLFSQLSKRRQADQRALLFSSLYGLWCYHWAHAAYAAARDLAEKMLQLAEAEHKAFMLDQAHYSLGSILMDHGEFAGACKHLEQSANVLSRCIAAVATWNLGFPDNALKKITQLLAGAIDTGNPEHIIFANLCKARIHLERREKEKALEHAQLALDVATDQKLPEPWLAPIWTVRGWALTRLGQKHSGLALLEQSLKVFRAIGPSNLTPFLLCVFAELSMDAGRTRDGLDAIKEALSTTASTGMNHYDAELYRLKGELLFRQTLPEGNGKWNDSRLAESIACFEQAIEIARNQEAKSLELRATTSLAILLNKRNNQPEAHKRLRQITEWFSEGFHSYDLQEARTLLQNMS